MALPEEPELVEVSHIGAKDRVVGTIVAAVGTGLHR